MKITFILPSIGRRPHEVADYVGSWQMEPLAIAALAGATPPHHELVFFDDRVEPIRYDDPTDLVAINAETFTAKRAYQIASRYHERGIPVVLGGFHPTLVPDEAGEQAEAVMVGEAEQVWPELLRDAEAGQLKKRYRAPGRADLCQQVNDRSIFKGKGYLPITLIESGRGCNFRCNFCSVTHFFDHKYVRRPLDRVIGEIESTQAQAVFFVDDNIASDPKESREFFRGLAPLKTRWVSQMTIDAARDEELLDLAVESGCVGLLIGFESLSAKNLAMMNKRFNSRQGGFERPLKNLADRGIKIYATFLLGYDDDDTDVFRRTLDFCMEHKFFLVAFNHLVPFPGTPLYRTFEEQGRLLYDKWWLDERYQFGEVAFAPKLMTAGQLAEGCQWGRRQFYSWQNMFTRALDFQTNVNSLGSLAMFFSLNHMLHREVDQKKGMPLGFDDQLWQPATNSLDPRPRLRRLTHQVVDRMAMYGVR
jgi:radical SAM superfamily enzyme YgiQ (UPF0313 family)